MIRSLLSREARLACLVCTILVVAAAPAAADTGTPEAAFGAYMDAMRSGRLCVEDMISQRVPLDAAVTGFAQWAQPGNGLLKTILRI